MPGDELQMKDYLLGKLSSEERADVEDRYFSDERYFAELRRLEKKLIREYLRGRLDTFGRDEFESALARLPGLQKKVARQEVLTWKPLQVALVAACLVAAFAGVWRYWAPRNPSCNQPNRKSRISGRRSKCNEARLRQ